MSIKDLDATFVNLFLESVEDTFNKVLNKEMTRGQLSLREDRMNGHDVAVLVGITGKNHTGITVYSMKGDTAERMIQSLDSTYTPATSKDILYDGLGEVVNILSGNAMTLFGENEIDVDMSAPSVIAGNALQLHVPNQVPLSVEMLSEFGTIEIFVGVKRYQKSGLE